MFSFVARRRRPARTGLHVGVGIATGSLATIFAALLSDRPRRARIVDRLTHEVSRTRSFAGKAVRDGRNRLIGLAAETKRFFRGDQPSDETLVARVRAVIGRAVSHPHALRVEASNGYVLLTGPILEDEVRRLIRDVRRVRGVRDVEARLDIYDHERAKHVSSLQGRGKPPRAPELRQMRWTPSLRLVVGAIGLGTLGTGFAGFARGAVPTSIGLTTAGALLLSRSIFDEPIDRILGISKKRRSVDFQKTITIHAPIEEVFAYWADFEKFPEFMDHVESVSTTDDRRSHWRVRGPLGTSIEWDSETTRFVPNEEIGWKSVEGSALKHAGIVRFEPVEDGRATRVSVRLTYNPVAGRLGHAVASLFRVDPKKSLDDDLLRLKSLLEEGKATAHHRETYRTQVHPIGIDEGSIASSR